MRDDEPRNDEVEEKDWVDSEGFAVGGLTVAHEDDGGVGGPGEAAH